MSGEIFMFLIKVRLLEKRYGRYKISCLVMDKDLYLYIYSRKRIRRTTKFQKLFDISTFIYECYIYIYFSGRICDRIFLGHPASRPRGCSQEVKINISQPRVSFVVAATIPDAVLRIQ